MDPYFNYFKLLRTISALYVLVTVTCTRSPLTHDEECSALFQFKQSIIFQEDPGCYASWFRTFHTWKPTRNASDIGFDCCLWDGVECNNSDKFAHVIGLDLSGSFLCGYINSTSTLFSLVHLQRLNLAMNDFDDSQIPFEIARLWRLKSLNLSASGFSGQIPNEISQLMHLSSLDLSWNPLKLQSPNGLKHLMQNLTGLEELHLSGVDINSSVPQLLANCTSLRSIMLRSCLLQNKFPSVILELPKLKSLDLSFNGDLTGSFPEFHNNSLHEYVNLAYTNFFGIIPISIRNLNKLKVLYLSGCFFSGRIGGSLSNLTQLTFLGLGGNKFKGLFPSLESLSKLNVLELSGVEFKTRRLPNWLSTMTKLSELYVDDMNLNGKVPPFFANLTKLSVVTMGRNSLSGQIPSSLFNLTHLRKLHFERNQLQGPISNSFSKFRSLQDLRLNYNNFSGKVDLDIFLGLNKLETLALGYNRISLVDTKNYTRNTLAQLEILDVQSCNLKEFPVFLRFQNKMKMLFFSTNKISGQVPVWIWNNSQETLQVIQLTNNHITGFDQHPHILPWRHLEGFFIGYNQIEGQLLIPPRTTYIYDVVNNNLTGEIPPSICEVKSLRVLDLSSNNIGGTLPACFGSSSNLLRVLNLKRNKLYGQMMNAFIHGSSLESIDLSENGFTGQLPRSLANCTKLEVLSVGDNIFEDVFPFWLGTLSKLQVLILHSNKFYGPIYGSPDVCSYFPKLRIIDLSNNGFTGQVDQNYFKNCNAMKSVYAGKSSVMGFNISSKVLTSQVQYSMTLIHKGVRTEYEKILTIFTAIDLSCNHFEGEMPTSLHNLGGLQSLNLSNNHFTSHILPSLGYLKNLESLDLSQNDLFGEIPRQLVQLNFLSIFKVAFNNLHGRIPQGKQFNTFENDSYEGNPGLCGKPLSKECQDSNTSRLPPESNMFDSLLPSEIIDWIFIFAGVGSGLVVGIIIGNFLYSDRFTLRNDRWVRPLHNKRRNQGLAISSSSKGNEKA